MASVAKEKDKAYFSAICVERCGGICCDPWWGIISYQEKKSGGLSNLSGFKSELIKGIRARAERIVGAYVTSEAPPRPLFSAPEKYNVVIRGIRAQGSELTISLIAMFAFRCAFLSEGKTCSIHPAILGAEIRPGRCGKLGDPGAALNEEGCCRIIHAAASGDSAAADKAVEDEKLTSARSLKDGVGTPEEAAEKVVSGIKAWCERNAPQLFPKQAASAPGRNDPCWCGSGQKFKKCHG